MGMDVHGKAPTTEKGGYFRNNVWWWRPLADYILEVAPRELTNKCKYWQSNDCAGLNAEDSLKLAAFLRKEIAEGRTKTYSDEYAAILAAIPPETCFLCDGTGIRSDTIGVDHGQTTKIIDEPGHPRNGQTGWCNGCNGVGKEASFETNYPFSVENVEEFCTFLEGCGGFEIC